MSKIVNIDFNRIEKAQDSLKAIRSVLKSSGVIAFPTDTFYGLGANPMDEKAVDKIFSIKRRSPDKPILILVASLKQLDEVAIEIPPDTKKVMQAFWPGPLTLLFRARPSLPQNLTAGSGKVGVRFPANDFTLRLIESVGHPLTAPSANISGAENIRTARGVEESLGLVIDLIVDGIQTQGHKESTILDSTLSPPELLREGEVTKERIEMVLGKTIAQTALIN